MVQLTLRSAQKYYRNSLLVLILILGLTDLKAQTQLYFQDFNTGSAAEWSLNVVGGTLGGTTGTSKNYWIINDVYNSGTSLVNNTPDEPAGVTGYPESYYLHVTNGDNSGLSVFNADFDAPATGDEVAWMNIPIVTTGYTGVTLTFWYLCNGGNAHYYGQLYYTLDGGTTWMQEGGTYASVTSWTQATITDPAWNNVASLEFAFRWVQTGGGALSAADPPWAVDDFKVEGASGGVCPLVISSQASTNPTCNGSNNGTITITASGGTAITYTINNGAPISNSTGSFTGLAPGTYTVSVSDTCTTNGTNIVISNPSAISPPSASNTGPYCAGNTMQLNATTVGGATYAWTGPNNFSTQNPMLTNITTADAGTYSVVATVGGCNSTPATTTVVINAAPASPSVGNNGPICAGDTLKLTASTIGGATYSWTGPGNFSAQNPIIPDAPAADSGTYTVVATIGGCSSAPVTTTAIVHASPAAPVASNTGPACAGGNIQLNATTVTGATYAWTGPNNFSVQNPSISSVSLVDSGTYTVVATLNGCNSAPASTDLIVIGALSAPIVSNNGPLCTGQTLQLSATSVNGASYAWTGPVNFNTQHPSISNVTIADSGTYTVVASVSGCSSPSAITTVIINQSPASPTVGNNGPVCAGATLDLTATTIANATYAWTGPNNFNMQNPNITNATVADSGTYTLVITVGTCSSAPVTTTAVVHSIPATPTATNTGPYCTGGTLQLNATTITGASYTWTGPNNFIVQNPSLNNITLSDAGTYTVVAAIGNCNSLPATTTVQINATPAAPAASNTGPVCSGSTVQLNASTINNATYSWSGPNNFNTQNPSVSNVTVADSGVYSVIATVGGCASAPATTRVIVLPPPATPTAGNNGPVCAGATLNLTSSTITGASYTWTGPNSFNVQNPSIASVTVADAGTYSVIATVGNCNSLAGTTTVVVNQLPASPTVTTTDSVICSEDSATICVQGTYAGYTWSNGDTTACFTTADVGNYNLTVTDGNGCTASSSNSVNISNFTPTPVTVSVNGDTLVSNSAAAYQWYLNGQIIQGATSQSYIATQSGSYVVQITDSHGCHYNSSATQVVVGGISQMTAGADVKVYPNPLSNGNWQVDIAENLTGSLCEIFDANGSLVYKGELSSIHSEISLNAAAGVYMLQIHAAQMNYNVKLIKLF